MAAFRSATTRRTTSAAGVVFAFALALAACGGAEVGSGSEASDDPTDEDAQTAPEPYEAPDDAPSEAPEGFTGDQNVCVALYPELAAAQAAYLDASGEMMAGGEFDYGQAAAGLRAAAEVAPAEIRDDFMTMAEILGPFYETLDTIDIRPGEQPDPAELERLMAATQQLDQAALERAGSNIEAYFNQHC